MVFRIILFAAMAAGATLAPAEIVGVTAVLDGQNKNVEAGLAGSVGPDANLPEFLAVVAGIPRRNQSTDELRGDRRSGDDRGQRDRSSVHDRHLGLGFAHGMSIGNGQLQGASGNPSPSD